MNMTNMETHDKSQRSVPLYGWLDNEPDRTEMTSVVQRCVATLEREVPRVLDLARDADVEIGYVGIAPLFNEARTYAGEESDWVLAPAKPSDAAFVPKAQAQALARLDQRGIGFPVLYVGHEIMKGKAPGSMSARAGSLLPVPADDAIDLVGPVPPPASTVSVGEQLNESAKQVFAIMRKTVPIMGAIAAAPFVLAGAAIASIATLDPVVFGAIPAASSAEGEPAAWYVLARWEW